MHLPPLAEVVLRSVAVYLFIVLAIRLFGKKELAQLSVVDLVFILLISNAVQNAMVGSDTSLLGGIVAALALFATNFAFKKLLYKNKKISELIQGKSIVLVYQGKLLPENLLTAKITEEEIEAAAREHGVENISEVRLGILEMDGNISIVSNDFSNKTTHLSHKTKHKLKGRINKF
ncbi:MAG: YetF domain-containing protein [Prolixibacteraceae bacterium]